MTFEVARLQLLLRAAPGQVRNAVNSRIIMAVATTAALPIAISSVPSAHTAFDAWLNLRPCVHVTLEASLNLLWLLLAVTLFLRWASTAKHPCRVSGSLSLLFGLALLFPVISANDDVAELELINDAMTAQSFTTVFKNDKQITASAELSATAPQPLPVAISPILALDLITAPPATISVSAPGETTGNHSPPLC